MKRACAAAAAALLLAAGAALTAARPATAAADAETPASKATMVTTAAAGAPQTATLANGARLVTLYEPGSPLTIIDVFFRAGVDDEAPWPGVTGLVTRAWFADARWRTASQIQRDLGAYGTGVGSSFGGDFAEIWSVSGSSDDEVRESAQTLLLNLVASPGLGADAVAGAKGTIQRALARDRDNPLTAVLDRLRARLWSTAPQGRPALGTPESLEAIPAAAVTAYYRRLFRPRRAVIVVAGSVRPEEARRLVEANLGAADWTEAGRPPAPDADPKPETVPAGLRDVALARPAPASVLAVGRLAPGTAAGAAADWPALLVLDAVLAGGKSSRLFRLRDDGELPGVYEVRTALQPSRIQSLWAAYAVGNFDPAATRAALEKAAAALATGERPVTDAELARAKAYLKGRHAVQRQRLKDRAYAAGWSEIMGLGAAFDTDYDARLDAVTLEQVNALARAVLGTNAAVVYTR